MNDYNSTPVMKAIAIFLAISYRNRKRQTQKEETQYAFDQGIYCINSILGPYCCFISCIIV